MLNYLVRLQRTSSAHEPRRGGIERRRLALEALDRRLLLSASPGDTIVTFDTSLGSFQVELYNTSAPQTVANFLNYVDSGDYNNTFFHRIVDTLASSNSSAFQIVQGGGYSLNGAPFSIYPPVNGATHIDTSQQATLPNEYSAQDPDAVGTIAMALTSNSTTNTPNATSGTSEWFFNVSDNTTSLGPANQGGVGYAVFGQVLGDGMSIIDKIDQLPTLNDLALASTSTYIKNVYDNLSSADQNTAATFASAPVQNFDIDSGQPLTASNLIVINSVTHPSVTGTVYLDSNGNATQDSGESGLAGLTVYADVNHDGVFDAGDASAVTDADGNYTLTNLAAGTYSIRVAPASGLTLSSPTLGSISVTLAQGQVVAGQNFGEMLAAPSAPVLPAAFDTGTSQSDQITNLTSLQFQIAGVQPGATVQLFDTLNGSALIGTALSTGTSVTIATTAPLGEGEHLIVARQTLDGDTSADSLDRGVIIDTTPPQITTTSLSQATVGVPYSSTITTDDMGGATFSLASPPAGMTIGATSGVLSWTPNSSQAGQFNVTVVATDLAGNASQKTFALDADGPPQFAPIGSQTVVLGSSLSITPSVQSIDTPLTYSLEAGGPADATFDPTTGLFLWTPTATDLPGPYHVTIDVLDAKGQSASSGPISILLNAPPVFAPVANLNVDEQTPISLPLSISDQGTVTLSFAGAAPQGAAVASTGSNTGLFTWTPSEAQGPGTYTIQVKATDTAGLTVVLPFQITVNEVDTAPVINPIAPISVSQGQTARVHVTASDTDLPAQALIFSLDPAPPTAQIDPQIGLLTWDVPAKFAPGVVNLTVRVTEVGGQGLSVTQPVVLNVGTAFNGFDLFTTAAVQLGGFAQGLAVDNGVPVNSGLTIAPFGSSQPGALPAQVAALAQLAGLTPAGTPSTDAGTAGHLAAGIVDIVLGFDSGIPHNGEGMDLEALARLVAWR